MGGRPSKSWTPRVKNSRAWDLYVLEGDNGLYVGISQNFKARIRAHRKGECTTSSRLGDPSNLRTLYRCHIGTYEEASALEDKLHRLSDNQVRELIEDVTG